MKKLKKHWLKHQYTDDHDGSFRMIQARAISDLHNGYIRVVDMWPRAQIQLASVRSALIDEPPPEKYWALFE